MPASLELMGNWILQIAHEGNFKFQEKVLAAITPALQLLNDVNNSLVPKNNTINNSQASNTTNDSLQKSNLLSEENLRIPSFFVIKLVFKLYHINLNKLNLKNCHLFGNELAEFLLKN